MITSIAPRRLGAVAMLLAAALSVGGCARDISAGSVSASEAQRASEVSYGVVTAMRPVTVDEFNRSNVQLAAGLVGAGLGALAGAQIGGGVGRGLAIGAGATAGAALGSVGAGRMQNQEGMEVTVRLDSGRVVAVVQANDQPISVGSRVRLVEGGGRAAVVPSM